MNNLRHDFSIPFMNNNNQTFTPNNPIPSNPQRPQRISHAIDRETLSGEGRSGGWDWFYKWHPFLIKQTRILRPIPYVG